MVPDRLISTAGEHLRRGVRAVTPLVGGYTPQQALRLLLEDGTTAVLKAAPPHIEDAPGPVWRDILCREIEAYRNLDMLRRWMPGYLGAFTDDGWQALLLEDLGDADRVPPLSPRSIDLVAAGMAEMHAATFGTADPRGWKAPAVPLFFHTITSQGRTLGDLPAAYDNPEWWSWLEEATVAGQKGLEVMAPDAPRCIVHFDVRSDNLFLRGDRLLLVDWPDAAWQTPAIDSVYWALGVEIESGEDARDVHENYLRHFPDLDESAIRYAVSFCLGCFIASSQRAGVPARLAETRRRFIAAVAPWFADLCGMRRMPAS